MEKFGNVFTGSLYTEKKNIKKVRKKQVFDSLPEFDPANTQIFLDVAIGFERMSLEERPHGRIVLELFDSQLPLTC